MGGLNKKGKFVPAKQVRAIPPWPINTGARSSQPKGIALTEVFRMRIFGFILKIYRIARIDLGEFGS